MKTHGFFSGRMSVFLPDFVESWVERVGAGILGWEDAGCSG